jgi:hypothetical protein
MSDLPPTTPRPLPVKHRVTRPALDSGGNVSDFTERPRVAVPLRHGRDSVCVGRQLGTDHPGQAGNLAPWRPTRRRKDREQGRCRLAAEYQANERRNSGV